MRHLARAFPLLALLALPGLCRCEGPALPKEVKALQEFAQQAIARAEPSVASVLVSRSDAYRRWGALPSAETPGQLGRFDSDYHLKRLSDDERGRLGRVLRDLDLSLPDTVPESCGSGVVIAESGLVLTCAHVVRNATKVYVRLPGNRGSWADVHASDPRSDLAVLRLLDRVSGLRPLPLGDGSRVAKGQFVIALANPFAAGFRDGSPCASWAMVSNVRRRAPGNGNEADLARRNLHHFGTLIELDTRVSLGRSGGALLNLRGELIGLTTALAALSGSEGPGGFAIPLDAGMKRVVDKLRLGEEVEYGFLGVRLATWERELPGVGRRGRGVPLSSVDPGTPAARAGLRGGDYILSVNGTPVRDYNDLFLLIGIQLAGAEVRIEAAHGSPDAPRRSCRAKLAKFYVPGPVIASKRPQARGGLRVDYTSILTQRTNPPPFGRGLPQGVLIREVQPNSSADKVKLQPDKIITHVNGSPVTTPAEFYDQMARAHGSVDLTLYNFEGGAERVTIDTK
jgi:S1-C subfamily serine protease